MAYPRPQLRRAAWQPLDGEWQFAFDAAQQPGEVNFTRTIQVPYSPETPRSGVNDLSEHPVVWYALDVSLADEQIPLPGDRVLLHFGAVDWAARVWVGGQFLGEHQGGYTPFTLDITHAVAGDTLSLQVRASDDAQDMAQPRGKQDWEESGEGHGIWYPRTSGIWQSVWLETVPAAHLRKLDWTPDLAAFSLTLSAEVTPEALGGELRVTLRADGKELLRDTYSLNSTHLERTLCLPDPGIDDARMKLMWWPEHPQLIDATLELLGAGGELIDRVESYTALRSVGVDEGRFLLNNRPYPLRLALDQGYWPEGGLSATDDEYRADVELARRLGFNGVRKHQKIESPQWLSWCDRVGLLVWEELPSAYAFTSGSIDKLTRTWLEVIERDRSHPCIVVWVPFNESWGVPDLPLVAAQRALVQSLYSLTRSLDPSRLAVGNDGWEHVASDLLTIHDYTDDPQQVLDRYGSREAVTQSLHSFRSAGRALTTPDFDNPDAPAMLTEFGGISYRTSAQAGWGYSEVHDAGTFLTNYQALLAAVHESRGLAGFCYTQLTDTYQEMNGLTDMQRLPKADAGKLAEATRGKKIASNLKPGNPLGYHKSWLKKHPAERSEAEAADTANTAPVG